MGRGGKVEKDGGRGYRDGVDRGRWEDGGMEGWRDGGMEEIGRAHV